MSYTIASILPSLNDEIGQIRCQFGHVENIIGMEFVEVTTY